MSKRVPKRSVPRPGSAPSSAAAGVARVPGGLPARAKALRLNDACMEGVDAYTHTSTYRRLVASIADTPTADACALWPNANDTSDWNVASATPGPRAAVAGAQPGGRIRLWSRLGRGDSADRLRLRQLARRSRHHRGRLRRRHCIRGVDAAVRGRRAPSHGGDAASHGSHAPNRGSRAPGHGGRTRAHAAGNQQSILWGNAGCCGDSRRAPPSKRGVLGRCLEPRDAQLFL
mmetsp:Transcript_90732/g.256190  ORF Transcript_90732/g.256190 Transcript_90732/m.256190 type:complete len:231 (+) Transcript_90732:40-732(+)